VIFKVFYILWINLTIMQFVIITKKTLISHNKRFL